MDFPKDTFCEAAVRAFSSLWEAIMLKLWQLRKLHILHLSFARIISENAFMYLFLCNL